MHPYKLLKKFLKHPSQNAPLSSLLLEEHNSILKTEYRYTKYVISGGGVVFNFRRSHGCRILELEYIASGDSSDGRILWVEVIESTGTRKFENVESALFQCGDSNETGDSNSEKGDGRTASGDSNFIETTALPVNVL